MESGHFDYWLCLRTPLLRFHKAKYRTADLYTKWIWHVASSKAQVLAICCNRRFSVSSFLFIVYPFLCLLLSLTSPFSELVLTVEMLFSGQMFGSRSSDQGHLRMISGLVISENLPLAQMSVPLTIDPVLDHRTLVEDAMDLDQVPITELSGDSALMLEAATKAHMSQMPASGTLMRYHSAPSSILASMVNDFFSKDSSHMSQVTDAEFAQQYLADDLSVNSSHRDAAALQITKRFQAGKALHQQCGQRPELCSCEQVNYIEVGKQQSRFWTASRNGVAEDDSSLSAIYEHEPEGNSDNFCSSQMSVPCGIAAENFLLSPTTAYTSTSHTGNNLIRHSSLPGALLSQIAMEVQESSERTNSLPVSPAECSSYRNSKENAFTSAASSSGFTPMAMTNRFDAGVSNKKSNNVKKLEASKSCLLRQSSSPAGLLSQLSLEGIMEDANALRTPSPSHMSFKDDSFDRKGAAAFFQNVGGTWDDEVSTSENMIYGIHNNATSDARKRIRDLDAEMCSGCMAPEQGAALAGQLTLPTGTISEGQLTMDRGLLDAVLCRARAKRGCATHPRSIAERVRRTKISERMKKLQELVPNMDKQTNTAEMLDEAVEYIKSLQRQIQHLSEKQSICDGSCSRKAAT